MFFQIRNFLCIFAVQYIKRYKERKTTMTIAITILILIAIIVALLGIIGAVVPSLPGPPLCFASLLDGTRHYPGLRGTHHDDTSGRWFQVCHVGNHIRYLCWNVLHALGNHPGSPRGCFLGRDTPQEQLHSCHQGGHHVLRLLPLGDRTQTDCQPGDDILYVCCDMELWQTCPLLTRQPKKDNTMN